MDIIEIKDKTFIDSEIDPFASEKGDSSSELSLQIEKEVSCCTVLVPMVGLNEILVEISVPFTIKELFIKLQEEEEMGIFDSNGKFNGRIYCNKEIVKDENESIKEEMARIIFIHDLLEESKAAGGDGGEGQVLEMSRSKTKTLISKFKNLWTTKEKEKIPVTFTFEFVGQVLNYLKRDEMIQEGLFRLSGTFTRIKILQDRLNSGESFNDLNLTASDCHNVTSLLKQFLRNLPEPLLTFELYEAWRALGGDWTGQPEISVKIANFLVNQLPKLNKKVLVELMKFLNERLKDSETTRMNACNYGTVIGPNLLWHPQEDRQKRDSTTLGLSLQSSTLASQICTLFLQNYDEIFDSSALDHGSVMAYGKVLYDYSEECGDVSCEGCECEDASCEEHGSGDANSEEFGDVSCDECECEDASCDERECGDASCELSSADRPDYNNSADSPNNSVTATSASPADNSDTTLRAGQLIFINRIDDSIDGWWLAYTNPHHHLSKFPSNYVQVIAQRTDKELIKLL